MFYSGDMVCIHLRVPSCASWVSSFTNWGGMTWRHSCRGMRRRAGTATPDSLNCWRGIYKRYECKEEVLQTLPSPPSSLAGPTQRLCLNIAAAEVPMTGFSCVSHSHSLTWKYSWSCCRDMSCLGSKFLSTKESLLHLAALAAWMPCAVANDRNCNGHSGKGRLRTLDMAEARKLPYSLGMPRQLKLTLPNTLHSSSLSLSHVFTCFCIPCWCSMAQIQNHDLFKFGLGPLRTALGLLAQGWPGWPKQMVKPCQHCRTEINKHNVEWHASSKCPRPWFAIECERNLYHTVWMYHVKCGALLGCACRTMSCVSPPFHGPKARVP